MIPLFYLLEYLVTGFVNPNETELPSPEALKRKIILKVDECYCIAFLCVTFF